MPSRNIPDSLDETARRHVHDILTLAIGYRPDHAAVVVADSQCELAMILANAYRACLPQASFIEFDSVSPESILEQFETLVAGDLVVLVQSTNFRLGAYRIRVELFKRGLKVIEHPHLSRMTPEQVPFYLDSLAYDPVYFRGVGKALKERIDRAASGVLDSGGEQLLFSSSFESAKLNVGDYGEMSNVGGQFPIGEVFTEAHDLEAVNGRVRVFAFGDTSFSVNQPAIPPTLIVEKGRVTGVVDSTEEFDRVLANIRADEGEIWVRELGFGLNRAFTATRRVDDIGTYERMCGIHLSLGAKHGSYNKPQIRRADARHHVDVFAVTESVKLDEEVVYRDGAWLV